MGLNKRKLGELIQRIDRRNFDLQYGIEDVRGVTNTKQIMPTRADISDRALDRFLVVEPNEFVFNRRTTRMGERLGLGFNDSGKAVIFTEDYVAFSIRENVDLIPEYLYLFFLRDEFDRYVRYDSWGSATEFFNWEEMCDVRISLPRLTIQQKYVDIYKAMLANQQVYGRALDDLNIAIEASLEKFKHSTPRVAIGELLEEIDVRNHNCEYNNVQGININKEFMPSVANLQEIDLAKYKVIYKNQFAYSAMQTGRDECIRIALFHEDEPVIISPAYSVLQTKNESALAEFIMLWFSRSESDRFGWFISDSSIRASLELSRFFEIEIPLPSLPQQQAVVNFYNARYLIQRNITTLRTLANSICPILIKGSLEEALNS